MGKKQLIILGSSVVVAFVIGFFIGDSSATNRANKILSQRTSTSSTNNKDIKGDKKKEENNKEKTYKVGDTIKIDDKYEVTISKVYLTDDRNQYHEQKFEKVAIIEYSYKNLNSDEDLFISEGNFKIYDEEGNALATYPANIEKHPQRIAKSKQCTAQVAYGFNKGSKLELHLYSNTFNSKANSKVILDVQ